MHFAEYFAGLARYHAWATHTLLAALAPLSDDAWHRDAGLYFHSVHGTVNHLLLTDRIWFGRFAHGESIRMPLDAEIHAERDAVVAALADAVAAWRPWVGTLEATRFDGELRYTRNNGEPVRLPFTPALGHVFNHATHHRGQLSAAITAAGLPGPEMDWISLQQVEAKAA